VGAIPQLPANKAAVQAAIGVARTILQGAGIAATFNEFDFAGGDVVTNPYFGSELYLNISAAVPSPAVNVCIAADFDITGLLGISGGLPGSPLPGARSCVGISVLNNAGVGGVYGAPELNLLGETLAHETGHYLGLFHPVETDWVTLDPLPDTAACAGQADCVSKIQNNLMFPLPILDGLGNYVTQNQLTPQQAGVMNRHSAVF